MAREIYGYLVDSMLFGKHLENDFISIDEKELKTELNDYREFVLKHYNKIKAEVMTDYKKISVTIESFGTFPDEELLKQLALYIDCVIIADPVFALTEPVSESTNIMSQYMGMREAEFDKTELANALRYMKKIIKLVSCGFVKFVPISILHEAPQNIPIRFDKNNFNDCLPTEIMDFLRQHIKVHNLEPCENGLKICSKDPLRKGTSLYVYFPECKERMGEVVQYMKQVPISELKSNGTFQMALIRPAEISDIEFSTWLNQSINVASEKLCQETYQELYFAQQLHSMYLTKSKFKADLLAKGISNNSTQSKLANLALKLDVPVFQGISLDEIISIRQNYGSSFANFRNELGNKLIHLNGIKDDNELKNELEIISYEINESYICNIDKEIKSLKRSLRSDIAILTGSLLSSYVTGGISLIGAAAAAIASGKDTNKLFGDMRDNPGYFLWKIDKKKASKWNFL